MVVRHSQSAMLQSYRQREYDTAVAAQHQSSGRPDDATAAKATGQSSGLRKEAQFLHERLASDDLSLDERNKAIEIIRLIEGPSQAPPMSPTKSTHSTSKSPTFDVSSDRHNQSSSNLAMDLKMHDLTKSVTKMRAFDKFQRQQQDSDRLTRIEQQLAKSKEQPRGSDKPTPFQKRTAREVEKLNKRLDELLPKKTTKSEQVKQDDIDELKAAVKVLKKRCGQAEEDIDYLSRCTADDEATEYFKMKKMTTSNPDTHTASLTSDPAYRGGTRYPSKRRGSTESVTKGDWYVSTPTPEPVNKTAHVRHAVNNGLIAIRCDTCGTAYWSDQPSCPLCAVNIYGWQSGDTWVTGEHNHLKHTGYDEARSSIGWNGSRWSDCGSCEAGWGQCAKHADPNECWPDMSVPHCVDTVTPSAGKSRLSPVESAKKTKSSSPGIATPGSSWDAVPPSSEKTITSRSMQGDRHSNRSSTRDSKMNMDGGWRDWDERKPIAW